MNALTAAAFLDMGGGSHRTKFREPQPAGPNTGKKALSSLPTPHDVQREQSERSESPDKNRSYWMHKNSATFVMRPGS